MYKKILKSIYNILDKFIDILIPVIFFIIVIINNILYNPTQGGEDWGGLVIAIFIIVCFFWFGIICIIRLIIKNRTKKTIIKFIISLINCYIVFKLTYDDILVITLLIISIIYISLYKFYYIRGDKQ